MESDRARQMGWVVDYRQGEARRGATTMTIGIGVVLVVGQHGRSE